MRQLDPFTIGLLAVIAGAVTVPAGGTIGDTLGIISQVAVAGLFFLHGAALSRDAVREGITHWRLHLLILSLTFCVFPLIVLPIPALAPAIMPAALATGFLYLGALPSAVTSSIAFTAMARGNVPAAVCSAAASNVFGLMLTPFVFMLLASTSGAHGLAIGHALKEIVLQLLLPFALGQLARPKIGTWLDGHQNWSGRYDRGVILLIVYTAFSQFVASGYWRKLPVSAFAIALGLCVVLLAAMICIAVGVSRATRFSRADESALLFCGTKKSLASGLPMANVLFAGMPALGMIILPIMIYNQLQILAGAFIARYYARRIPVPAASGAV